MSEQKSLWKSSKINAHELTTDNFIKKASNEKKKSNVINFKYLQYEKANKINDLIHFVSW